MTEIASANVNVIGIVSAIEIERAFPAAEIAIAILLLIVAAASASATAIASESVEAATIHAVILIERAVAIESESDRGNEPTIVSAPTLAIDIRRHRRRLLLRRLLLRFTTLLTLPTSSFLLLLRLLLADRMPRPPAL